MLLLSIFVPILFTIVCLVLILSLILANKTKNDREKSSPFECGFDMNSSARLPFSIRFFLISIIFLIFDIEIVLLMPAVFSLQQVIISEWSIIFLIFVLVLLGGLIHEWNQGALNWTI